MTCLVSEGDAPFNISWSFEGGDVDAHGGVTTTKIGERASLLLIDSVSEAQVGNYTCTADNVAGSVRFSAVLSVNGTFCYCA